MNNSSLKMSIITVCFNASNTIEETIISVVKQTYKNIEYIIIDGGSSDQTNNIIDKYSEFISYYCSEPDDGIYDAMNKGLEYVTGDYVLFLGADDHLISYSVIEQVCNKILLYNEEKVFYGDVFRPILNDIYCNRFTKIKLAVKNIPHQGVFYPRCVYKRYKYDLKYNLFADYYYNISLFSRIGFEYLGLTISYFNDLGSSARLNDLNFEKDEKKIKISKLGYLPFLYSELYHFLRNLIKK